MTDAKQTTGFSFQLSETPPDVAHEGTDSLGELDLDLHDFGPLSPEPPLLIESDPVPQAASPLPQAASPFPQAASPLPQAASPIPAEARLELVPAALRGPGQPVSPLDFSPLEKPVERRVEPKATTVAKPSTPARAAKTPSEPTPAAKTPSEPTRAANDAAVVEVPKIKKISFPAQATKKKSASVGNQKPASSARKVQPSPNHAEPSEGLSAQSESRAQELPSTPRTRLSASLSQRAPRVMADSDRDSDPALDRTSSWEMSVPDDLPEETELFAAPKNAADGWGAETPTAKDIWKKARVAFEKTRKEALSRGGQGLKNAGYVASQLNAHVRKRMEEAANDRKVLREESQKRSNELVDKSEPNAPKSPRSGSPVSPASRAILGLVQKSLKKSAAPLSALGAAFIVYWGSSQLLGQTPTVALSHTTGAPGVPDLGTLPQPSEGSASNKKDAAPDGSFLGSEEAEKPTEKAPSMQTEQTALPEGVSFPGKGLIEVVTSEEELIYVDGVFTGRGPLRRIPVTPGEHEIRIKDGGTERSGKITVTAEKRTRAVFKNQP